MQKGIITGKPFSPLTIEDYQRSIEGFLTRHPKLDFQAAQLEMMRCPTEQYGKRFKMHKAFVCFAKYLEAQGMASEALINDLKRLRPKRHLPPKRHAINDAELAKLLDVCKDLQDRLILVLLATTGLRVSEACNLKLCEIDPIQGFLVVNLGKGNKTRRLGVGDTLMGLIQDYVSTHPHDKAKGYLLINQDGKPQTRHGLRQTLKRLGNKAGVKVTPHSLRRYFATSNLLKGRPLPLVQRAMGHADIATTRAYCQDTEQQLIDAMRGWE
jgi:integrase/recombinase XerD